MARAFCPKCGHFSFAYDPRAKIYRCYSVKCEFIDRDKKYGEGLAENPFSNGDLPKLENIGGCQPAIGIGKNL
jgi:hypothetical protein